jgi:hypothetical protein
MRFFIFFILFLQMTLFARENPFVPVEPDAVSVQQAQKTDGIIILTDEEATAEENQTKIQNPTDVSIEETPVKEQSINYQQIRFVLKGKTVRIETKDALKKDFAIANPMRIILDFKSQAEYPSRKKSLTVPPFSQLRIGSHKGYYRVVLELEHAANYSVTPFKYGYTLTLH